MRYITSAMADVHSVNRVRPALVGPRSRLKEVITPVHLDCFRGARCDPTPRILFFNDLLRASP